MDRIEGPLVRLVHPLDQLIERWWEDHFPGSAIARDTAAWNIAHAAKETLKRLLTEARNEPGGSPGAEAAAAQTRGNDFPTSMETRGNGRPTVVHTRDKNLRGSN